MENELLQVGTIVALGISAQWLGWRLHLPSIPFLLLAGLLAGPIAGFLHPDAVFGKSLMPLVSISVALILFEGGLTLQLSELKEMGRTTWKLVTFGALITLVLVAAAAHFMLGIAQPVAILLGAILVVTGPTVVGPLLLHIRPRGSVGSILKWEGILIDPIGAVLAVLLFEAVVAGQMDAAPVIVAKGVFFTLCVGLGIGGTAAYLLVFFLRRYWIPEHLQTPVTVGLVILSFVVSNNLVHESGLLTVTLMGIILANQRQVQVRHVIEFKENLRVLLISSLFVLLAARLKWDHLTMINGWVILFVAFLILVVRPVAVLACTVPSRLSWRERGFLAWMAPRGIVAAAISSVFADRLAGAGYEGAQTLVALTFLVVASTVLVYGLTSPLVARFLKVSQPDAQGAVIIGAHPLARAIAQALKQFDIPTLLVDSNWSNVSTARVAGLRAHYGDAISERILEEIDFDDMGRVFAMTANNQVNSLATLHFADIFGRTETYQLPQAKNTGKNLDRSAPPAHLRGRTLFGVEQTFTRLNEQMELGGEVRVTKLTKEFSFDEFLKQHAGLATPLYAVTEAGNLRAFTAEDPFVPAVGNRIISLIRVDAQNGESDHREPEHHEPQNEDRD